MCSADVLRLNHPSRYGTYKYSGRWLRKKEKNARINNTDNDVNDTVISDYTILFYKKQCLAPTVCVCVLLCFIIIKPPSLDESVHQHNRRLNLHGLLAAVEPLVYVRIRPLKHH